MQDIQFQQVGQWAVMVCPRAVHSNPAKYEDPVAFNPLRWEVGLMVKNFKFFFTCRQIINISKFSMAFTLILLIILLKFQFFVHKRWYTGNGIKWCIQKFHGFWWWNEILCWNRLYKGADGRLSPLPGYKVQVKLSQYVTHTHKHAHMYGERQSEANLFYTKLFRWKAIKGGDIVRTPGLQFPNGFHVQITEKKRQQQETTDDS